MPALDVAVLESLVLEGVPNLPAGSECLALTVALSPAQLKDYEQFFSSTAQPRVALKFGPDEELARLRADVQRLEAEVQRYRAAYDTNPAPGASRASLLEVD